jgi:hypothetical protein
MYNIFSNWHNFQVDFVDHGLVILSYVILYIIHFKVSYIKSIKIKYLYLGHNTSKDQCVSALICHCINLLMHQSLVEISQNVTTSFATT